MLAHRGVPAATPSSAAAPCKSTMPTLPQRGSPHVTHSLQHPTRTALSPLLTTAATVLGCKHALLVPVSHQHPLLHGSGSRSRSLLAQSSGPRNGDGTPSSMDSSNRRQISGNDAAKAGQTPTPGRSQFGVRRAGEERGKGGSGYTRENRWGSGGAGDRARQWGSDDRVDRAARREWGGDAYGTESAGKEGGWADRSSSLDRREDRRGGGQRGMRGQRDDRGNKGSFAQGFQDEEDFGVGRKGAVPTRAPKAQRSLLRSLDALRSTGLGLDEPDRSGSNDGGSRSERRGGKAAQKRRGTDAQEWAASAAGRGDFEVIGYEPISEEERRQQQHPQQQRRQQRSAAAAAAAAGAAAATTAGSALEVDSPKQDGPSPGLTEQEQQGHGLPASQAASNAATGAAVSAAAGKGGGSAALSTAAAADSAAAASLDDELMDAGDFVDENDGARVWSERLAAAGLVYDEEEEEWEENVDDDESVDEDEDEISSLLTEITPYGTWFSGDGSGTDSGDTAQETEEQMELSRWYTSQDGYLPPCTWGPVQLVNTKGKGRGLVVSKDVQQGELLLVSQPLAMLEYVSEGQGKGEDDAPENEELADHMCAKVQLNPAQHLWLNELLWDGQGEKRLPTQEDISALHAAQGPQTPITMDLERLYRIVNLNCQGEEFKDVCASTLRGEEAVGHLGLWPEAALINHSCTPNATSYVIGDRLIVRATEELAAGEEVTLSYLGRQLTKPLETRQAELRDKFGFESNCPRTRAELRSAGPGSKLGEMLNETAAWCLELSEVLDTALEEEDMKEIAEIRGELEQRKEEVEAAMRTAKVTSKARRWLQASMYDMYDMISMCADEGESDKGKGSAAQQDPQVLDTEALAVCARILESVARGSDAQAYLAAEYMVRAGVRFGQHHEETHQARRMCKAAFTARYGPVSDALLDTLIATRLDD